MALAETGTSSSGLASGHQPPASDTRPALTPASTTAGLAAPEATDEWTCPCLNVRLRLAEKDNDPDQDRNQQQRSKISRSVDAHRTARTVALAENQGISVTFPYLTTRENVALPDVGLTLACTRCLNCSTLVYGASRPAPPGPARTYGFMPSSGSESPSGEPSNPQSAGGSGNGSGGGSSSSSGNLRAASRDARPYEPFVRPLDGQVVLLPEALPPKAARQAQLSDSYSPAFRILVQRDQRPTSLTERRAGRVNERDSSSILEQRDLTPTRPSVTGTRRSSIGPNPAGNIAYTLPVVPTHLITPSPQSPRATGPAMTNPSANPTQLGTSLSAASVAQTPASSSSLLSANGFTHPLANMLDAAAVERLREFRSKAEAEVFELLRQKRREMEALEKRTMEEAEALLEATRSRKAQPAASGGASLTTAASGQYGRAGNLNGAGTSGRGRGSSVAAPEGVRSRDSAVAASAAASSSSASSKQIDHGYHDLGDHEHDHDTDLLPMEFERRSTAPHRSSNAATTVGGAGPASGARQTNMSTSLSALSASFAMRGREAPAQLEDWASKRRLRERYPEGDHSALTSAVTSTANSLANSTDNSADERDDPAAAVVRARLRADRTHRTRETSNDSLNTEDEMELAGRGRGRGPARASSSDIRDQDQQDQRRADTQVEDGLDQRHQAPPSVREPAESSSKPAEAVGPSTRGRSGRSGASQLAPPTMSSSFRSKAPATILVDDGKAVDDDTPQVGGRLVSPQSAPEPSGEVTLRPRNPPPSSAEPLKPATRGSVETSAAATTGTNGSNSATGLGEATPADRKMKTRRSSEKKVAFAEAEDTVGNAMLSEEDEGDDDDHDDDDEEEEGQLGEPRELVDETDAAVFEIDEEGAGDEDAEPADGEGTAGAEEGIEVHGDEASRAASSKHGIRRGSSGRIRGQGDDALPGLDDHLANSDSETRAANRVGAGDDDGDSSPGSLEKAPGFGAASFSALAARESAMSGLAASISKADNSGFDPASLRLDGRVVPETSSGINGDDLDSSFVVGSAAKKPGYRGPSGSFRPSSISRSVRSSLADAARVEPGAAPASAYGSGGGGGGGSSGGTAKRSGSRSRTTEADTEIRLSVAPNAPSHRGLWMAQDAKGRKAGKLKYQLDEEDDQKWAAWQQKVKESESFRSEHGEDDLGRSVPMNVAPPTRFLSAGSAVGGKPMRGPTLGGGSRKGSVSSAESGSSVAGSIAIQSGQRTSGYAFGSYYDSKSGFDREPKTSLPYNERMMVPSLRKAIRRSAYEQSRLETIEDQADEVSTAAVFQPAPVKAFAGGGAAGAGATTGSVVDAKITTPAESRQAAAAQAALPSSVVVTRGFDTSIKKESYNEVAAADLAYKPLSATVNTSVATGAVAPLKRPASETLVATLKSVGAGTHGGSGSGSGTSTPVSVSRRSPRAAYVRPPPPRSYNTVLKSDPAMAPKALKVFEVPAATDYQLYEEGEEEETEEGWEKTLQFLHRLEALKTNPRTGWLHHRVSRPESIADHMYRMGMMAILLPEERDVDLGKCVMLALVHDLAEAEVGDLTPLDGVPKAEKMAREHAAIQYFAHDLLGSSAAGLRIEALWNEYEARESKESRLVKDLDRFELALQAVEYERREGINDLQAFFEGSVPQIAHPKVRRWTVELMRERTRLWAERGVVYEQEVEE